MDITVDFSAMPAQDAVSSALTNERFEAELERIQPLYEKIQQDKKDKKLGFAALPFQSDEEIDQLMDLAGEVRLEADDFIVIGIGGSDLGARAAHRALNHQFFNLLASARNGAPRLFFLGDTTDPVALHEVIEVINLARTSLVVISKSGNTVEQMSTFVFMRQLLIDALGEEAARHHIIVLTDPETGTLREIANEEGYRSLPIPAGVGGRFSVLSTVGLFPLAIVGIDVRALLDGARQMDAEDVKSSTENSMIKYAIWQYLAYHNEQTISVLMPYTYSLREFGFWFRQLWAESLGKRYALSGEEVWSGPTPIAAVGPTDQHSQMQLYMEGPNNKVFTFIKVDKPNINYSLPEAYPSKEGVSYLKGHDFNEILLAEQKSSALALQEAGRPTIAISLSQLNACTLGQLFYFYEMATTYTGALFSINTFDQPGVEIGKKHMYTLLGRPGF